MFEGYFDDEHEFKEISEVIDEVKQEFPLFRDVISYLEAKKYAPKLTLDDYFPFGTDSQTVKWFKKWFGDST